MTRYMFRLPIDGTVEVTADGETLEEAVENYMSGVGYTDVDVDVDYIEDSDRAVALGRSDDDGEFVEL